MSLYHVVDYFFLRALIGWFGSESQGLTFLRVIGRENSRHYLNQSDAKL